MNCSAPRTAARSGGPPRQTRAASGGTPCVANASLATTPMPVERMWPTKAERVQGAGSITHRWKPIGSVRMPFFGRIAAATRRRDIVYHGNIEPGERVAIVLRVVRRGEGILAHWCHIERENDAAPLADV